MPQLLENQTAKTWQFTPDKLTALLGTDSERGLAGQEVERRRTEFGLNELPEAPPPSLLKLFLSQFTSVIVWVLIGAAVISGLLEDWLDAAAAALVIDAPLALTGQCGEAVFDEGMLTTCRFLAAGDRVTCK